MSVTFAESLRSSCSLCKVNSNKYKVNSVKYIKIKTVSNIG